MVTEWVEAIGEPRSALRIIQKNPSLFLELYNEVEQLRRLNYIGAFVMPIELSKLVERADEIQHVIFGE